MRIAIDASGLGSTKTGTSVYLTEILSIWAQNPKVDHTFIVFVSRKARKQLDDLKLDRRFELCPAPENRQIRILWQQIALPWHLALRRVDVHWGCGFVLPLFSWKPMVVSIHDLTFHLFPMVHETIKRYYFPAMISAAVRKARFILTISETTRNDLFRLLPASRGKTVVTHLAARSLPQESRDRTEAELEHIQKSGRYVLYVGTVEPRKNLARLVEAWGQVSTVVRGETRLVIVGARGWMVDDLLRKLSSVDGVEFLERVTDEHLGRLLRGALIFAYPSLYEGFGLPVVEAMAAGIPVITSRVGATEEVAGNAAMLVDPLSVASIRDGLERLLSDDGLRECLANRGKQRASEFSWELAADTTLSVIVDAVGH